MSNKSQPLPENYEDAISELEAIVNKMEAGTLPLEQSLNSYKRGTELLHACQKTLTDVEQQVHILSENNTLSALTIDKEKSK